jgi:UDP-2,3-diacylglucosamine pyrophosphatase LpxH
VVAVRTDWHYRVKNVLYRLFQFTNRVIKRTRRLLRLPYWSLATTVNTSVAAAARLIANYEEALAGEARCQGMDGIICGHIHHAALRDIGGVQYCNTGDWVDSCTALVEHADGRLSVLRWNEYLAEQEARA